MSQEERRYRAQRAQQFLESEFVTEAFETLEQQYIQIWRDAKTVEAREDAHRYITLLEKLRGHIGTVITDGVFAEAEIKEMEGQEEQARFPWFRRGGA